MDEITRNLQISLIPMFKWFHEYCEEHKLRYYAIGGTILGAVRHGGFIPWDDDIDIGMPRSDYNKLTAAIGNQKIEHYYLETPESHAFEYRYPYSKLYNTNTTLVENTWPELRRGIFLDIFPIDGYGDTESESTENWLRVLRKSNFIWARTCAVRKERSFVKNCAVIAAHLIPKAIAKDKARLKSMNDEAQILDFDATVYGCNTFGNWGIKEMMPNAIMGTPTKYMFEGLQIYGPEDYDAYLTHLYRNWKQLPPEEKQVTHHDFLELDLNKPYLL